MKIIVDTNIIFSALLREENRYANTLIKNELNHNFYAAGKQFVIKKQKPRSYRFKNQKTLQKKFAKLFLRLPENCMSV